MSLLIGLSPQSAYVNTLAYRRRKRDEDGDKRKITDAQEATHYLMGLVTTKAG